MMRLITLDIMAIPLSKGLFALVDGKNFEWLNQWKWCVLKIRNTFYAVRAIDKWPKQHIVYMHRQILNVPKEIQTDHRNHCGLDNREYNLRICTITQNQQNQTPQKGKTSKYKGVSWNNRDKKWVAQIRNNRRLIYIGYFDNEIEAAEAYDGKAKELFGEFAYTNF